MHERWRVVSGSAVAFLVLVSLAVRYAGPSNALAAQLQREIRVPEAVRMQPVVVKSIVVGKEAVQSGRFRKLGGARPTRRRRSLRRTIGCRM